MAIYVDPEYEATLEHVSVTLEWRSRSGDSGSHTLTLGKDQSTLATKNYLRQLVIAAVRLAGEKSPDQEQT